MSLFVTFEGADGVGKSTIANLIYEELLKRNFIVSYEAIVESLIL